MATKIKLLKLLQEMHAFSEMSRRHPSPKRSSPLYLLQLRSHLAETSRPRRKLAVSIDLKDTLDLPHPVRITRIGSEPAR